MHTPRLLLALVLALLAATCGGEGGDGGAEDCVDLSTQRESFTIRLVDNEFVPSCFTAGASQSLTLMNEDPALHSFTVRDTPIDVDVRGEEMLDLDPIAGMVEPGTYELVCKYHLPAMTGQVTIVE